MSDDLAERVAKAILSSMRAQDKGAWVDGDDLERACIDIPSVDMLTVADAAIKAAFEGQIGIVSNPPLSVHHELGPADELFKPGTGWPVKKDGEQ